MVGNLKAKHKRKINKVGNLKAKHLEANVFSLCPLLSLYNPNPLAFLKGPLNCTIPYLTMNLPITLSPSLTSSHDFDSNPLTTLNPLSLNKPTKTQIFFLSQIIIIKTKPLSTNLFNTYPYYLSPQFIPHPKQTKTFSLFFFHSNISSNIFPRSLT